MLHLPRFVIAAPQSGSGKTTISTGLMSAFSKTMAVQPFKAGPDYIDPTYHSAATGTAARNIDTWLLPHDAVLQSVERGQAGADLLIIEGVMGLFDGFDALTERGSTAEIAKLTQSPVILVIDVSKMARSAGAVALGLRDFDTDLNVQGVICNKVGSDTHAKWVTQAIEQIGLPVIGCLPRIDALQLPERHLGLHLADGSQVNIASFLKAAADAMHEYVDLEQLLRIAEEAPSVVTPNAIEADNQPVQQVRIAVAKDAAFCFYYQDNFDLLKAAGAELVWFSPIHDQELPEGVDGLYLGGGYPELFGADLAYNESMMRSLQDAIKQGMPTYAECGGLIFLTEGIQTLAGAMYPMLGLLPGHAQMRPKVRLGYREITALQDTLLLQAGEVVRGHEFHYSDWHVELDSEKLAYAVTPRHANTVMRVGYAENNLLASYVHIHFAAFPELAQRFVARCRHWRR